MVLQYRTMARDARRQLADLRAMEEEDARMTMRGGAKHFIGAGATPSMGLSQFRGGSRSNLGSRLSKDHHAISAEFMRLKRLKPNSDPDALAAEAIENVNKRKALTNRIGRGKEVESETEEEEIDDGMEGGRINLAGLFRSARVAPAPIRAPPSTALTVTGTRVGSLPARPSFPASYYQNLFRGAPRAAPRGAPRLSSGAPAAASLATRLRSGLTAANIARAASLGIPVAMLASYLADQGGASGDAGFYDDYAGEEFGPSGGMPVAPEMPVGLPSGLPSSIPSDMTPDEVAWYLRSGNLPERYTSRGRQGRGVLQITHGGAKKSDGRSARAEVVKKVMKERGVNLAQASKIVKAEGLYSK